MQTPVTAIFGAVSALLLRPVPGVRQIAASMTSVLGLSPVDPVALAGVSIMLMDVVLLASAVPARRAACVHPVEALRSE